MYRMCGEGEGDGMCGGETNVRVWMWGRWGMRVAIGTGRGGAGCGDGGT